MILIGCIRESAGQHFSSRDRRGAGVAEGAEEAWGNDRRASSRGKGRAVNQTQRCQITESVGAKAG